MTCKEKARQENPDDVKPWYEGGVAGCPSDYGYLPDPDDCRKGMPKCGPCWNREIPEEDDTTSKPIEIACASCLHGAVCKHKDEFAAAQKAVDEATVYISDERFIELRNIPWIKPVTLKCDHYRINYKLGVV